jgi:hypothetical protein
VVTRRARTAGRDAGDGLPQRHPINPGVAETTTNQMLVAARTLGLELHVLNASIVLRTRTRERCD